MKKEKTILYGGISSTPEERADILYNHHDNDIKEKIIERHIIEYIPVVESEPETNMFQSNLGIVPVEYMDAPQTMYSPDLKQERRDRVNKIRVSQRTNRPPIWKNPKERMDYINTSQKRTVFNPKTTGNKEELSFGKSIKKEKDYEKIAELFYPNMKEESQIKFESKHKVPLYEVNKIIEDKPMTIADSSYIPPLFEGNFTGGASSVNNDYDYNELKNMAVSEDDKNFFNALDFVYKQEGGYSNNKNDAGGKTNFGLTQDTYNDYCRRHNLKPKSVKNLSQEETIQVYYNDYWKKSGANNARNIIEAIILFDTATLHGVPTLKKFIKLAKGDVYKILDLRRRFYKNKIDNYNKNENNKLNKKNPNVFFNGWNNRVDRLEELVKRAKEIKLI